MSICYTGQHGIPMGRQHRPLVAWYGDLDFMPHIKAFIEQGAVDALVTYGEPVPADRTTDRKAMTQTARRHGAPAVWRPPCAGGRLLSSPRRLAHVYFWRRAIRAVLKSL